MAPGEASGKAAIDAEGFGGHRTGMDPRPARNRLFNTPADLVGDLRIACARLSRPRRSSVPLWPRGVVFNGILLALASAIVVLFVYFDGAIAVWVGENGASVYTPFQFITALGKSGWILVICAVAVIATSLVRWTLLPRRTAVAIAGLNADAVFVFASVAVSGSLISLVKNVIGRARPRWLETLGQHHFEFAAFDASFASFPSGHSTTFGALAMAIALLVPKLRWAMVIVAVVGGASRSFVGAHYLSDIVAGLVCGAVMTVLLARTLGQRGIMFSLPTRRALPVRRRYKAANPFSRSFFRSLKSSSPT